MRREIDLGFGKNSLLPTVANFGHLNCEILVGENALVYFAVERREQARNGGLVVLHGGKIHKTDQLSAFFQLHFANIYGEARVGLGHVKWKWRAHYCDCGVDGFVFKFNVAKNWIDGTQNMLAHIFIGAQLKSDGFSWHDNNFRIHNANRGNIQRERGAFNMALEAVGGFETSLTGELNAEHWSRKILNEAVALSNGVDQGRWKLTDVDTRHQFHGGHIEFAIWPSEILRLQLHAHWLGWLPACGKRAGQIHLRAFRAVGLHGNIRGGKIQSGDIFWLCLLFARRGFLIFGGR